MIALFPATQRAPGLGSRFAGSRHGLVRSAVME